MGHDMTMGYSPFSQFATTVPVPEDGIARAGEPLPEGEDKAEESAVVAAMKTVHDPEIPVDIYELGLIYKCDQADNGNIAIEMTLTAPACPVAGILPQQLADTVAAVPGVGEVTVEIVWDPPWNPSMMSEAARVELDMF
jgi:FeS assembly SUF system protein